MVLVSYPLAISSPSILTFPPDTSKSRQALQSAEKALSKVEKDKKDADEQLAKLSDPAGYGTEGEWKKLQDLERIAESYILAVKGKVAAFARAMLVQD